MASQSAVVSSEINAAAMLLRLHCSAVRSDKTSNGHGRKRVALDQHSSVFADVDTAASFETAKDVSESGSRTAALPESLTSIYSASVEHLLLATEVSALTAASAAGEEKVPVASAEQLFGTTTIIGDGDSARAARFLIDARARGWGRGRQAIVTLASALINLSHLNKAVNCELRAGRLVPVPLGLLQDVRALLDRHAALPKYCLRKLVFPLYTRLGQAVLGDRLWAFFKAQPERSCTINQSLHLLLQLCAASHVDDARICIPENLCMRSTRF